VLSTCNRTEIFMRAEDADSARQAGRSFFLERCGKGAPRDVEPLVYDMLNLRAIRHLFEVSTSLDSLVVGEPHILGQVREDFERARLAGTAGKVLGRLFEKSLTLGKAAREETAIGESPVS